MTDAAATSEAAAFGVETSLTGRRWQFRAYTPEDAAQICATLEMPELVARLIAARHGHAASLQSFLEPTLRDNLPDPSVLTAMDDAVGRIADAVLTDETVAVFADYDVDGATSAALVVRYLAFLGKASRVYVPDRQSEGYGPNAPALNQLAEEGASLIICVDCGIAAHEAFDAHLAAFPATDIVVLDHHQADEVLPRAHALVNPNRLDDTSGLGALAAVGVTFLTLVALNRDLRRRGAFDSRSEPDLMSLLGLVALGTVADVVPLTGLNRVFVAQGLRIMGQTDNPGLTALGRIARMSGPPGVGQLGFVFGPRINAGGRVGRANLGVRLLTTSDPSEADALAAELERLNRERQAIEAAALATAHEAAEAAIASGDGDILVVAGAGWHPGVVGLVAARLKEHFRRPAVAIAIGKDGTARGSARSMPGVDIGTAIRVAAQAGVVTKGGGHAMAAGLTMESARIAELRDLLVDMAGADARKALAVDRLSIDAPLAANGANEALMKWLDRIGPFGAGMPEPRFVFPSHTISFAARAGDAHIRLTLKDGEGAKLDGISFRTVGTPLGDALLSSRELGLHIAGKLKRDHWQGRTRIKLHVDDAAPVAR